MNAELQEIIAGTTCTYEGRRNASTELETLQTLAQWVEGSLPSQHGVRFVEGLSEARVKRVVMQNGAEVAQLLGLE